MRLPRVAPCNQSVMNLTITLSIYPVAVKLVECQFPHLNCKFLSACTCLIILWPRINQLDLGLCPSRFSGTVQTQFPFCHEIVLAQFVALVGKTHIMHTFIFNITFEPARWHGTNHNVNVQSSHLAPGLCHVVAPRIKKLNAGEIGKGCGWVYMFSCSCEVITTFSVRVRIMFRSGFAPNESKREPLLQWVNWK